MVRRLVATALWAYFAWYLVALVGAGFGLPGVAGPIAAALMVPIALIDWRALARGTRPAEPADAIR
jgi:hypothetical protein